MGRAGDPIQKVMVSCACGLFGESVREPNSNMDPTLRRGSLVELWPARVSAGVQGEI